MSLGLLTRASSGWGRVFGIAEQGLVAVVVRVAAGVLASQNSSFLEAALVQNHHFWRLARVRAARSFASAAACCWRRAPPSHASAGRGLGARLPVSSRPACAGSSTQYDTAQPAHAGVAAAGSPPMCEAMPFPRRGASGRSNMYVCHIDMEAYTRMSKYRIQERGLYSTMSDRVRRPSRVRRRWRPCERAKRCAANVPSPQPFFSLRPHVYATSLSSERARLSADRARAKKSVPHLIGCTK